MRVIVFLFFFSFWPRLMLKSLSYARPKAFSQSNHREKIAGNKDCRVGKSYNSALSGGVDNSKSNVNRSIECLEATLYIDSFIIITY